MSEFPPLPPPGERLVLEPIGMPDAQYGRVAHARLNRYVRHNLDGTVSVGIGTAEMLTGAAASGKTWARWQTTRLIYLTARPDREWLLMRKEQTPRGQRFYQELITDRGQIPAQFGLGAHGGDLIDHYLPGKPPSLGDLYPLLDYYGNPSTWATDTHFRAALRRQDTVTGFARALYGRRYRKDLAREIAQSNLGLIYLTWQFRGLVPTDWIVDMLARSREKQTRTALPPVTLRPHLRHLDERTLRRLAREGVADRGLLDDLARARIEHPVTSADSWRDLHDQVALRHRTELVLAGHKRNQKKFSVPSEAVALEGRAGNLDIKIARNGLTLIGWGSEMRHCIASYVSAAANGGVWLGGIYDGENLIGNFSIRDRRVDQMFGKFNSTLPETVRATVETHLSGHGIDTSQYWGRPGARGAA